eukprot:214343-Chlamydomonas_euryale.AAC.3
MCACGSVTSTLTRRPRDGTTSSGVRTSKSSQPGDRCAAVPDASSNAPTLSLYVSEVRPLPSAPPRACTSAASPRCGHRPSNRSDSSSCVMTSLSTLASMPSASPTCGQVCFKCVSEGAGQAFESQLHRDLAVDKCCNALSVAHLRVGGSFCSQD